jgi:RNA polymerase sigma factor (sigma-70 family)
VSRAMGTSRVPDDDFSAFYRKSFSRLVTFLICHGARFADAIDMAQEAMVKACQHWHEIREPNAWVRRVASREYAKTMVRSEIRTGKERRGHPLLQSVTDISDWEERHDILRLLALLPLRQRQIMAWTLDGFSPTEIAEELQLNAEAVRSNLYKARRTLAAHMKRASPDE